MASRRDVVKSRGPGWGEQGLIVIGSGLLRSSWSRWLPWSGASISRS